MLVRVYETQPDGSDKEIGVLRLKGGHVYPEPIDQQVLLQILSDPAAGPDTEWEAVAAREDPEKFLANLQWKYSGAYLRASAPKED